MLPTLRRHPLLEVGHGLFHPFEQGRLRSPAEIFFRSCGIDLRVAHVTRSLRQVLDRCFEAGDFDERVIDLVHAGFLVRSDAVTFAGPFVERQNVESRDVAGVDVIARLLAVPENLYVLFREKAPDEDRDNPRFARRVLAGPVDVAVTQRREIQPVLRFVKAQVLFADHLRDRVRRLGILRRRVGDGQFRRFAVGRAARREDHFADAGFDGVVEEVDQAENVDIGVVARVARADRDRMLRRMMADDLGRELAKDALDPLVANVEMNKRSRPRHVFLPSAAMRPQVVNYGDLMSRGAIGVGDMRSDEPGAAGDDDAHARLTYPRAVRRSFERSTPSLGNPVRMRDRMACSALTCCRSPPASSAGSSPNCTGSRSSRSVAASHLHSSRGCPGPTLGLPSSSRSRWAFFSRAFTAKRPLHRTTFVRAPTRVRWLSKADHRKPPSFSCASTTGGTSRSRCRTPRFPSAGAAGCARNSTHPTSRAIGASRHRLNSPPNGDWPGASLTLI